jgi:exonuclease III
MFFYLLFLYLVIPTLSFSFQEQKFRLVQFNTQWLFTDYNTIIDCPGKGCVWRTMKEANIHLDYISNIINELKPSIINLCEIQGETEIQKLVQNTNKEYKSYIVKGTDNGTFQNNGLLTFTQPLYKPFYIEDTIQYPLDGSKCGYKGPISFTEVAKNFITELKLSNFFVTILSLHLIALPLDPYRCAIREAEAQIIQNKIVQHLEKKNEIIVLGDLNDFDNTLLDVSNNKPTSRVLDILKGKKGHYKDKYKLVSVAEKVKKEERFSEVFDNHNFCKKSMIDHILVSPKLYPFIKNVFVFHKHAHNCTDTIDWKGYFNSDHDPLVVDFQF